jgi:predicted transcriptional regulator
MSPTGEAQGEVLGVGPLEARVMQALWRRADWSSVGEVQMLLNAESQAKPISYSAVKAVLLNLTKKQFTKKRSIGRANVFLPLRSHEEHQRQAVADIVNPLLRNHRNPLFVQIVSEVVADQSALAEFERLLAERKAKNRG